MADTKISALADIVTLAAGDKLAVADASDLTASKSATMTEVNAYIQTLPLASAQITALGAAAALADTNTFPMDQSGTAVEALMTDVVTYLQTKGMPRVLSLTGDYTNSTTTGTIVTGLNFTGLVAGTYLCQWTLLVASASTGTSFIFGINYTGTVTRMINMLQFPSAGVTAATGTWIDVANATTGQVLAYANSTTETTTAPNLGPHVGVTNANLFHRAMVETVVVVSNGGDLELYAASEVGASQITIKAGSSGILHRTN
jgi:hypothetical protein